MAPQGEGFPDLDEQEELLERVGEGAESLEDLKAGRPTAEDEEEIEDVADRMPEMTEEGLTEKQVQQVEELIISHLQGAFDGLENRIEIAVKKALDTSYEDLSRRVRELEDAMAEVLTEVEADLD